MLIGNKRYILTSFIVINAFRVLNKFQNESKELYKIFIKGKGIRIQKLLNEKTNS